MSKIILKHPITNEIQIVEVRIGGGVAEGIEVIWDERLHGDIPGNFAEANIGKFKREDYQEQRIDIVSEYDENGNLISSQEVPAYFKVKQLDENGDPVLDQNGDFILVNGDPIMLDKHRMIEDLDQEAADIVAKNEVKWAAIRAKRNIILSDCDWTQLSDSPLLEQAKSNWATYRQSLRDIPANFQDPSSVIWPVEPT